MKIILYYLMFIYFVLLSSYGFYFYNEIHRRDTCAMLASTYKSFATCIDQDWESYEKIGLPIFLEMKVGEVYEGKVFEFGGE